MRNAQGHLVPLELVKPIDQERDRLVRELAGLAKDLNARLVAGKSKMFGDVAAFVELSAEQYGVKRGGLKGNVTLAAYVKRIAKVDDLRWAHGRVIDTLIETLKKWAMRRLPAAVAALRQEVIAAHRATPLSPAKTDLAMQAQAYLNRGQGFDMHWWAWECLMGVLDRPISVDVAVLKPQGAAQ